MAATSTPTLTSIQASEEATGPGASQLKSKADASRMAPEVAIRTKFVAIARACTRHFVTATAPAPHAGSHTAGSCTAPNPGAAQGASIRPGAAGAPADGP